MHNIGFCRKFEQQPCHFFVADEDVIGPFDQGPEVELFPDGPRYRDRTGHRDHEDMIDRDMGFEDDGDPDPPAGRDPCPSHPADPSGLLFSNDDHAVHLLHIAI